MSKEVRCFIEGVGGKGLPGFNEMEDDWARAHRMKAANKRKMWKQHISRYLGSVPKFNRIWVDFVYVEPNKSRDPDNIAAVKKLIFDTLVDMKVIKKDGWKNVAGWRDRFKVDKNNPGVHMTIKEVGLGGK